MRHKFTLLAAISGSLLALPANAATSVLTFSGLACTGTDGGITDRECTAQNQFIGGDYGSIPGLAVSYDAAELNGDAKSLRFLPNSTAFPGPGAFGLNTPIDELSRIIFTPAAGFEVSFTSFRIYQSTQTALDFTANLVDPLGNVLFSASDTAFGRSFTYSPNSSYFSGPLTFSFGRSGRGRGSAAVDDITFDLRQIAVPAAAAVPEPSSWLLMISGFGMIGAALRRRRRSVRHFARAIPLRSL